MTEPQDSALGAGAAPVAAAPARGSGALARFLANPFGVGCAAVLLVVVAAVALAPVLPLADPNRIDLFGTLAGPSAEHWLGTDSSGRDVLSRLVWGGQVNLLGAALAVGVAAALGISSGLVAGYYGRWFDTAGTWLTSMLQALPAIVVLLAVRAVAGPSTWIAMTVFGVMLMAGYFRIVRAAVQAVRGELYVDAARVSGLSDARIIGRHVLTVVRAPIIIQSARVAGIAIAVQAGLQFLGVGDNSVPSWGAMINEGFRKMSLAPLLVLWPALLVGLVCACLLLLSNALRDALEDRGTPIGVARRRRRAPASAPASESRAGAGPAARETEPPEVAGDLLAVRGLQICYAQADGGEKAVVHGVDLHVDAGEVLGLVGESGSGKTQTAFAVLGLLPEGGRVRGGSIVFAGQELTRLSAKDHGALRGTEMAYVPQEPLSNLDPAFRIGSQLVTPMRVHLRLSRADARERALALLARVGIPDPRRTFDAYPHEISGGMAQRVLIAGAISCKPKLLIADEPTTALDVTVQAEVLDLLRDLQREYRMGVVLVTHNFGVVADICDRVAVMRHGRIVETGDVEEIFTAPRHPYTRTLLDSMVEDGPTRPYPFDDDAAAVGAGAGGEVTR
ncbi:dipeptide/oligopeptide/nickel ABC transporter permease/ATP-binding protein [Pseudonocardia kunmingensis]|uniref:ABC-type dipeptide/oligopeptide/nickel transport system ATPase component n=1 Tax=Pseudonocardia kunmingensis TaxID=630975 RepID=A0A543DQD6_9PSEU|nr:dipeptide/oligopeptide/nickel ABC transporter permease/ATP-binding protein [Pseudonocardia kunmingensis]TQM11523.1 ABC-type dipeptide/oligopeptide/nickel transport system ATPase component [Pseudonocardia kunmingensis]